MKLCRLWENDDADVIKLSADKYEEFSRLK